MTLCVLLGIAIASYLSLMHNKILPIPVSDSKLQYFTKLNKIKI